LGYEGDNNNFVRWGADSFKQPVKDQQ